MTMNINRFIIDNEYNLGRNPFWELKRLFGEKPPLWLDINVGKWLKVRLNTHLPNVLFFAKNVLGRICFQN